MTSTPGTTVVDAPAVDDRVLLGQAERLHTARLMAEADLLVVAAKYADAHPPADDQDTIATDRRFSRDEIGFTTWGLPEVSAAAIAELAARLKLSTGAGRSLVGHALQLRHRLPRTWTLLQSYDLPPMVARKLAHLTQDCSPAAAKFVDSQVAAVAGRITVGQVERLVTAAILQHDPDHPEHAKLAGTHDPRGVWIRHRSDGSGLTELSATLDVFDGLALDAILNVGARELANHPGLQESGHQPLRAYALGDLARRQPGLDFTQPTSQGPVDHGMPVRDDRPTHTPTVSGLMADPTDDQADMIPPAAVAQDRPEGTPPAGATPEGSMQGGVTPGTAMVLGDDRDIPPVTRPTKPITLHVHLSADAFTAGAPQVGRVENTGEPVSATRIREWLGDPAAKIAIRPVIHADELIHTDAYEIPDRLTRQIKSSELTCVFPWCDKPATGCDLDHTIPYNRGGTTSSDNLAPLCRHHHRLKTHTHWRYTRLDALVPRLLDERSAASLVDHGPVFVWTSPYGYHYRSDRHGTTAIDWPPADRHHQIPQPAEPV
ncbi:DUF222 domain-containing protein [Propionibacteriaceae bacterium Y1700]|uniref:HNH endonuclease signature motif containing protein n=1 Tax=Microlunatus sp. Y1700 TaxID=3418487 RepID=UPI003DA79E05